jgi:hypothetical protein
MKFLDCLRKIILIWTKMRETDKCGSRNKVCNGKGDTSKN